MPKTISITIPDNPLTRINNCLDDWGYVYDPSLSATNAKQKERFIERRLISFLQSEIFNTERKKAIALEPNDTAALQAARFVGLNDVTSTTI